MVGALQNHFFHESDHHEQFLLFITKYLSVVPKSATYAFVQDGERFVPTGLPNSIVTVLFFSVAPLNPTIFPMELIG